LQTSAPEEAVASIERSVRGHPTNARCAGTGLRPLADLRGDR
jgi:hypothetical protein